MRSYIKSKVINQKQTIFDEKVEAVFTFESGAKCLLDCSVLHDEPFKLELLGSKAVAVGSDLAGDNRRIWVNDKPLAFEKNNPYLAQLENFIQAIEQKREPEVDVKEGVNNIKLLDQIWPRD